jgi:hypothetical protein
MLENSCRLFSARLRRRFSCFRRCVSRMLPHLQPQFVHAERLGEVVHRPEAHRFNRGVGGRERRHHERDDIAVQLLGGAQHFNATQVRHPDVREEQIDRLAAKTLEGLASVLGDHHVIAVTPQHDAQHLSHRRLVVNDQNAWLARQLHLFGGGRSRRGGFGSNGCVTHRATPCAGTSLLTDARRGRRTSHGSPLSDRR